MKFSSIIFSFLFSLLLICNTTAQKAILKKVCKLPHYVSETSGLIALSDTAFITINDSGNEPELIHFNSKGKLTKVQKIITAKNIDWESLELDSFGNLYIGDIGNNWNTRDTLSIYKITREQLKKELIHPQVISFSYKEQHSFPPIASNLNYDSEAFWVTNDSIYILSKNRTVPFDGMLQVHAFPNQVGYHSAALVDSTQIGGKSKNFMKWNITGSFRTESKLILLGYKRLWSSTLKKNKIQIEATYKFNWITQKEGIALSPSGNLYVTDEHMKFWKGRNLYKVRFKKND